MALVRHKIFMIVKIILLLLLFFSSILSAHEQNKAQISQATYLGNEGLMVKNGSVKILFDPFFHNNFNLYSLVPEELRQAIFSGKPPYDAINAVFISHAHGDHFAADDLLRFLQAHPKTQLLAPKQAIDKITALASQKQLEQLKPQLTAIELKYKDKAQSFAMKKLLVEVVRIPHAGWPSRADVSNLVFRVTLDKTLTVMHMGDADPNDIHFKPYKDYWLKNTTNTAFPPYWFFTSEDGQIILEERINTETSIGIHVPKKAPFSLIMTGEKFYSKSGETTVLGHKH